LLTGTSSFATKSEGNKKISSNCARNKNKEYKN
jgi:hypothetical protein